MLGMNYLGLMSCTLGVGIGILGIFTAVNVVVLTGMLFNLFGIALMIYGRNMYDHKEKMEQIYLKARDEEMRKWPKRAKDR